MTGGLKKQQPLRPKSKILPTSPYTGEAFYALQLPVAKFSTRIDGHFSLAML